MVTDKRPLSPHLQIYKWQWTMMLSILHRGTGLALTVGTLLLVYWLGALAAGPEAYAGAQHLLGSMLGQLALFLWTWSLYYHLCAGIRHLAWDAGYGFDIEVARKSGQAVIWASIILTLLTWIIAA
ncbi:MAG: succinate dehydrogenase, cytochrome b556 subunit [Pseudomonadota bacterium]|nr:succinate dehydrogenase, cytochrome b556 subunit [Pseudomonadota bacterium]